MAAIMVAVICVTAMAVTMCDKEEPDKEEPEAAALNMPSQTAQPLPIVDIKWKHNTYFESRVAQKATQNANLLKTKLEELSIMNEPPSGEQLKEWIETFKGTFFQNPTFWKDGPNPRGGWPQIIEEVWKSVHNATVSIDTLLATIDYKPHAGAPNAKEDLEHDVTLTLTYSTSSGDPIFEGTLRHSRVCEWI